MPSLTDEETEAQRGHIGDKQKNLAENLYLLTPTSSFL